MSSATGGGDAEHGLGGLKDRPRAGKKPIYDKATNKRILVLL